VHLFGQTADMDPIMEIAKKHNLFVIEDACQAHGAEYKGKRAGSIGDTGCFSFYPGKNLGAFGEAGAVTTNNKNLYEAIKVIRDHGQQKKYYHTVVGWNARMDGIQGAVLSVKLKDLAKRNDARRENARLYNELLSGMENIVTPAEAGYAKHVYHIYAIRCKNRDVLMKSLEKMDIHCGIHYPVPVHLQEAYHFLGYKEGSLPVAETSAKEFISLPMYPELSGEQIGYVCDQLNKANE
jgi:dTDP-4-amino-4,6-dideoxygalactose transaminase